MDKLPPPENYNCKLYHLADNKINIDKIREYL